MRLRTRRDGHLLHGFFDSSVIFWYGKNMYDGISKPKWKYIFLAKKLNKKRISYHTRIIHRNTPNKRIFTVFKNKLKRKNKFEKINTFVAKAKNGNWTTK